MCSSDLITVFGSSFFIQDYGNWRLQNISHYFFITSLNDNNLTLLIDEDIIIYINKIVHTNKFILLLKIIKIQKKNL